MHLEIDRVSDDEIEGIQDQLTKVLIDVRDAVEDWARMHTQIDLIIKDIEENPPPLSEAELEQGKSLLRWLGDNHFTFLGYREYALRSGTATRRCSPSQAPASASCARTRRRRGCCPRRWPPAPATSTCSCSPRRTPRRPCTVPVFLDYVGVKKFDENGEVVGERRFLGLFSSAAYTESVKRIPVLREKAAEVIDIVGLDPMSHAGKALMDVLETYPRDELFQTPLEDLVPIAAQVMYTRERRQLRLFVRRDLYGRFLSCLVYLPRDRYNTTVRERIAAILKEQLGGDNIEYTAHVGESFAARLHFVVRPARGQQIGEPDMADLERRCAEAARSWRDDFTTAVIATYGEEQRQPARQDATPTPSPRPTRRTTRRRPARPTSAGSRRSRATRGWRSRSTRTSPLPPVRPG